MTNNTRKIPAALLIMVSALWLALSAGDARAQQRPEARAALDTSLILIGDHVTLRLEVALPDSAFARFPVVTDTLARGVELLRDLPFDTTPAPGGGLVVGKSYLLTSFDSGHYHIAPLPVALARPGLPADTLWTDPLFLAVETIQIDSAENRMADIKAPMETPLTFGEFASEYLPYGLLALAAVALAAAAGWLYRRRRPAQPAAEPQLPPEEAHVAALRALDALADKKLWQEGMVKAYHSELSEILRRYLDHRFGMAAMEATTSEIAADIAAKARRGADIDKQLADSLISTLENADLVKFAKWTPAASENSRSLDQAYAFVRGTQARPEAQEAAETSDADTDAQKQ